MKDLVVVAAVVLSFAVLVTTHLTIAFGLAKRAPRWRGAVALVAVPLAPWWAWQEHMRARAGLWLASSIVYAAARAIAQR